MKDNKMETTNSVIDSVMSEASSAETDTPKVDDTEAQAEETEQGAETEAEESQAEGESDESGDDLPKNIKKALDKKTRYIRNLREREKALLAEVEKLKSEKIEPKQIKEDEFQGSYGEFIKQQAVEEMKAVLGQNQQQQKLDQLTLQQQQIVAEQTQAISEEAMEFSKQSDDFAKIVPANASKFDVLPAEIQGLFFELESPTLAAYALAKEGKIEQLAFMSPYMAATEIVRAQERGLQYLQATSKKQISNAPAPIQGVRGTSKIPTGRLGDKNPDELYKWIQS
jgi:hypothetical protein